MILLGFLKSRGFAAFVWAIYPDSFLLASKPEETRWDMLAQTLRGNVDE